MDELIKETNTLSLKDSTGLEGKKKLYVDGHNINSFFYHISKKNNFWNLESIENKVHKFVEAAVNSNIHLVIFYDYDNQETEEIDVWMKRREREVKKGGKEIPTNLSIILGYILEGLGIQVVYTGAPGTDIILASMAELDGADILSRDKDFLKFEGSTYSVFETFSIVNKMLVLSVKPPIKDLGKPKRKLLKYRPENYNIKNFFIEKIKKTQIIHMGCPTPLIKLYGNLYKKVAPLRDALYYFHKLDFEIVEILCEWYRASQEVKWLERVAKPNKELVELLSQPLKAIDHFFDFKNINKPENIETILWERHIFGAAVLVINICRAAFNDIDVIKEIKNAREYYNISSDCNTEAPLKQEKRKQPKKNVVSKCVECGKEILLTEGQIQSYLQKGWVMPKRCIKCKNNHNK